MKKLAWVAQALAVVLRDLRVWVWAVGLVLLTGCSPASGPGEVRAPTLVGVTGGVKAVEVRGTPQPRLPTTKLWLGTNEITAELAMTDQAIRTGMMFRTEMAEEEGMLFVMANPHRTSFWMKNTVLPLSCAYIGGDGVIREIHDMEPLNETPIEASHDDIRFVLEVNRGWFGRHGVGPGTSVRTTRGTLEETFPAR